jgi:diguanylate cyclase (GGDEF)-like protein/PAS domain S-box-containing protein
MDLSFERTLREREELYHSLFEDNHAVMLLVDPATGTIVDANGAAVGFYGYSRERLMLMRMSDLEALPQEEIFNEMRRASEERRSYFRLRHRLESGETRDVEVYTAPINVHDRNLLYSLVHDVTERRHAEEALREAEVRYRTLVEQIPAITYMDRVLEEDPTDVVPAYMSPQVEDVLGYTPEEWLADDDLWTKLVHPDDRDEVARIGDTTRVAGGTFSAEYRMVRRDGRIVWIRESSVLIRDEAGNPRFWQGIMLDVTEQKIAEQAVRASERRFRATFDGSAVGAARVDLDGRILEANHALGGLLGRSVGGLAGMQLADFVHLNDRETVDAQFGPLARGDVDRYEADRRYVREDGETIWVHVAVSLVRNEEGAPDFVIVMLEDVTIRKLAEQELSHRALHDPLTGLPNRDLLYDRLGMTLARMPRQEAAAAVLFLDLDRFKDVNDTFGHAAGDRLLVAVAHRLEGSLRPSDTVSRFGGDEFVLLCEDIAGEDGAMSAAWRVLQSLARPFMLDEAEVYVEASLGVAIATGARQRPEQLIRDADAAMYRAKELGRNRIVVFDPSMEGVRGRLEEMREAGGT